METDRHLNQSKGPSNFIKDLLRTPQQIEELIRELRRLNDNLERLPPELVERGVEVAEDLRNMLARPLGYRVLDKKS